MQRCKNCKYMLVLISRRKKYKCAKCGNLYPQKEVDNEEFRSWNNQQRELDLQKLKVKKPKLTLEQRKERARITKEKYRQRNKDKIRAKERENWHNGKRKTYLKVHYRRNIEYSRLIRRIRYYRLRQKALALQQLNIKEKTAYNYNIFNSPPTLLPYQVLFSIETFKSQILYI